MIIEQKHKKIKNEDGADGEVINMCDQKYVLLALHTI
jgi:hypothetical protein